MCHTRIVQSRFQIGYLMRHLPIRRSQIDAELASELPISWLLPQDIQGATGNLFRLLKHTVLVFLFVGQLGSFAIEHTLLEHQAWRSNATLGPDFLEAFGHLGKIRSIVLWLLPVWPHTPNQVYGELQLLLFE